MKPLFKLLFFVSCFSIGAHLVRALFNGEIEYISLHIDPNPVFSFANEPQYFLLCFIFYLLFFALLLWVLIFPDKSKKYMEDKFNMVFYRDSIDIEAKDYEPNVTEKMREFQKLQDEYNRQLEISGDMMKNGKSEAELMEYLNSLDDLLPEMEKISKEVLEETKEAHEEKINSLLKRSPRHIKILNKILVLMMVVLFIYFFIRVINNI